MMQQQPPGQPPVPGAGAPQRPPQQRTEVTNRRPRPRARPPSHLTLSARSVAAAQSIKDGFCGHSLMLPGTCGQRRSAIVFCSSFQSRSTSVSERPCDDLLRSSDCRRASRTDAPIAAEHFRPAHCRRPRRSARCSLRPALAGPVVPVHRHPSSLSIAVSPILCRHSVPAFLDTRLRGNASVRSW